MLSDKEYQCRDVFYDKAKQHFAEESKACVECIVVHVNWDIGMDTKIYRAKKMLQWVYDEVEYYVQTVSESMLPTVIPPCLEMQDQNKSLHCKMHLPFV